MKNQNKFSQQEIIMALRNSSEVSISSKEFKQNLLNNLERVVEKDSIFNIILTFMNKNKALMGVAALTILLGFAGWIYAIAGFTDLGLESLDGGSAAWKPDTDTFGNFGDDDAEVRNEQKTSTEDSSDLATGLRIATVHWDSVAEASAKLSFTPREPEKTFLSASLTDIETVGSEEDITKSDSLYLTYGKGEDVVYRVAQTKMEGFYEDGETISVDGVTGGYYMLENWEEVNDPDAIAFDGGLTSRSYIYWTKNSITYEISEFGDLSKAQLIELGNSMK